MPAPPRRPTPPSLPRSFTREPGEVVAISRWFGPSVSRVTIRTQAGRHFDYPVPVDIEPSLYLQNGPAVLVGRDPQLVRPFQQSRATAAFFRLAGTQPPVLFICQLPISPPRTEQRARVIPFPTAARTLAPAHS
jgi:hypothetical protein